MDNRNVEEAEPQKVLNFLKEQQLISQDEKLLEAIADAQVQSTEGLPQKQADAETDILYRDIEAVQKFHPGVLIRAEMALKFRTAFVPGDERLEGDGGSRQKLKRNAAQKSKIDEARRSCAEQADNLKELQQKWKQAQEELNQGDSGRPQLLTNFITQRQGILKRAQKLAESGAYGSPEVLKIITRAGNSGTDENQE